MDDWVRAPNISAHPDVYELENEALARDGRLDRGLYAIAAWASRRFLDIGCGTGFWLPRYAERADQVIGVEPDPTLLAIAETRVRDQQSIEVRYGSAESLPVGDATVDVAHARFAYFFGAGADAGLTEVQRVLAPGGSLLVIDNSWSGGDFSQLLRAASTGNATIDPAETDAWWAERGATRHEIHGGWTARSHSELVRILRIEFPADVVADFMANRHGHSLTYRFAVYEWRR